MRDVCPPEGLPPRMLGVIARLKEILPGDDGKFLIKELLHNHEMQSSEGRARLWSALRSALTDDQMRRLCRVPAKWTQLGIIRFEALRPQFSPFAIGLGRFQIEFFDRGGRKQGQVYSRQFVTKHDDDLRAALEDLIDSLLIEGWTLDSPRDGHWSRYMLRRYD